MGKTGPERFNTKTTPRVSQGTQELRSTGEGGPRYFVLEAQDLPTDPQIGVIGSYLFKELGRWSLESCLSNKNNSSFFILYLPRARYIYSL